MTAIKLEQIMEAILLIRVLFLSVVRVMAGSLQWIKIALHLNLQYCDSTETMQDLPKTMYRLIQKFSLSVITHQSL